MLNEWNGPTKQVQNKIPHGCNMVTEFVPKVIKKHRRAYWRAYCMASSEPVNITTKRWSLRFHSNTYRCRRTSHWDQEDYQKPDHPGTLMRFSPNGVPNNPKQSPNGVRNEMRNHFMKAVCRDGQLKSTEYTWMVSSECLWQMQSPLKPGWIPHQEMSRSANAKSKAACGEEQHTPVTGGYDHPVWSVPVGYGSMTYRPQ